MKKEQTEFIRILKDYLHSKTSEYDLNETMFYYAKSQQVEGIVYKQTKDKRLFNQFAACIYFKEVRERVVDEVIQILEDIPFFLVKGILLSKYYPDSYLRTMGDIDMVIHKADLPKVKSSLVNIGFDFQDEIESVTIAKKGIVEIEIHTSLIHSGIGDEYAKNYFLNCWDYVEDNKINPNYHFLFLIQHLKGHIVSHGVGFRQFMDIALFVSNNSLDWSWIEQELESIKLLDFTRTVFAVIERWFDISSPIEIRYVDNDFFEIVTEKVFSGGVFGHDDPQNMETGLVKQAIYSNVGLKQAKRSYIFGQIFPDYKTMSSLYYCSYLKSNRLLLPIAWLHRLFKRGLNKNYRHSFINRVSLSDIADERMDLLKKWGM